MNSASSCQSNNAEWWRPDHPEPVGAELARDDGLTFNNDVDCYTAIASKLGSYRDRVEFEPSTRPHPLKLP
ncbi:hypothetical protein F6476_22085 [Pseudomonas umsongensis]|nr:hypothetical protein F6476_22085 [Pseudomonas umsongensis]